jgi:AcrR family transcriptional regulator
MSTRSQGRRVLPRVERRRAEARERIVGTAARQFAAAGPDAVRMDQVAQAADVARGTLYSHFPTKDELLRAIVEPVLELAARRAAALKRCTAREGMDRLLELYLELWRSHPDALRIAYKAQDIPVGSVSVLHRRFIEGVMRVLERASKAGLLRVGDPVLAGQVLRQVAVPLLELYGGQPEWERLFTESVRGLLTSPPLPGGSARAS